MDSLGAGRCSLGVSVLLGLFAALAGPARAVAPPYFEAFNAAGKAEFNKLGVPAEALPYKKFEAAQVGSRLKEVYEQVRATS